MEVPIKEAHSAFSPTQGLEAIFSRCLSVVSSLQTQLRLSGPKKKPRLRYRGPYPA